MAILSAFNAWPVSLGVRERGIVKRESVRVVGWEKVDADKAHETVKKFQFLWLFI